MIIDQVLKRTCSFHQSNQSSHNFLHQFFAHFARGILARIFAMNGIQRVSRVAVGWQGSRPLRLARSAGPDHALLRGMGVKVFHLHPIGVERPGNAGLVLGGVIAPIRIAGQRGGDLRLSQPDKARLRVALSAAHTDDDIALLLDALAAEGLTP